VLTISRFRVLAAITAVSGFIQITLGGLVRVSGSGLGCPDWPTCYGRPYPPADLHAIIEYSHRANGALFGLLVILTVTAGLWLNGRRRTPLTWLTLGTLAAVVGEGLLGWQVVHTLLAPVLVMVHLAIALIILGLMVATVILARPAGEAAGDPRLSRLAAIGAIFTFVMLVTGSSVVASRADEVCRSWPLCGNGFAFDFRGPAAYAMLHRLTVLLVAVLLLHVLSLVLRRHRGNRAMRWLAALTLAGLLGQILLGAFVAVTADVAILQGMHLALATAIWAGIMALAVLSGRRGAQTAPQQTRITGLERRTA
jgi:heme A synthase